MKVLLVDPVFEIVLHDLRIESIGDAQRLDYYWHREERARGHEVERILIRGGFCEIMDRDQPFTVPKDHAGQVLDCHPVKCKKKV